MGFLQELNQSLEDVIQIRQTRRDNERNELKDLLTSAVTIAKIDNKAAERFWNSSEKLVAAYDEITFTGKVGKRSIYKSKSGIPYVLDENTLEIIPIVKEVEIEGETQFIDTQGNIVTSLFKKDPKKEFSEAQARDKLFRVEKAIAELRAGNISSDMLVIMNDMPPDQARLMRDLLGAADFGKAITEAEGFAELLRTFIPVDKEEQIDPKETTSDEGFRKLFQAEERRQEKVRKAELEEKKSLVSLPNCTKSSAISSLVRNSLPAFPPVVAWILLNNSISSCFFSNSFVEGSRNPKEYIIGISREGLI